MSIHSLSESRFWLIDGTPVSILPPCELADVRRAFPKAATITPEEGFEIRASIILEMALEHRRPSIAMLAGGDEEGLKEEIVRQFKERKQ